MGKIDINQLFSGYPNVAGGVKKMMQLWEEGQLKVKIGKNSLNFIYAKGHRAFRVKTAIEGREPKIVIYAGTNDPRRGSPLVKGARIEDVQKLRNDFGIPENEDGKPDWLKSLNETTPSVFYSNFVGYALKIIAKETSNRC